MTAVDCFAVGPSVDSVGFVAGLLSLSSEIVAVDFAGFVFAGFALGHSLVPFDLCSFPTSLPTVSIYLHRESSMLLDQTLCISNRGFHLNDIDMNDNMRFFSSEKYSRRR